MGIGELMATLRACGFVDVKIGRIRQWIDMRRITRPAKDLGGRFVFSKQDIEGIEALLRNPPRMGRPPKSAVALV